MESALRIVFVLSRDASEGKPKAGPAPSLFYDDVRREGSCGGRGCGDGWSFFSGSRIAVMFLYTVLEGSDNLRGRKCTRNPFVYGTSIAREPRSLSERWCREKCARECEINSVCRVM